MVSGNFMSCNTIQIGCLERILLEFPKYRHGYCSEVFCVIVVDMTDFVVFSSWFFFSLKFLVRYCLLFPQFEWRLVCKYIVQVNWLESSTECACRVVADPRIYHGFRCQITRRRTNDGSLVELLFLPSSGVLLSNF
jgi:hypothetical protein